ncbi:ATP-binding protein [Kitasatospora sp. NE20-6]
MGRVPFVAAFDGGPGTCVHARESAATYLGALAARVPAREGKAVDRILLVVSELVTNAVRHAPGPVILTLGAEPATGARPAGVRVSVRDTSPALPRPRIPDLATGTGGFGWSAIIGPLATQVDITTHTGGKEIHAVLPW